MITIDKSVITPFYSFPELNMQPLYNAKRKNHYKDLLNYLKNLKLLDNLFYKAKNLHKIQLLEIINHNDLVI